MKVDEDLPNFFKCVKLSQADEIIKEEENMIKNFGFQINDPDTIQRLKEINVPKKPCQGTPWYTILSNPNYMSQFNYIGAYVTEREKLIEDGQADDLDSQGEIKAYQKALRCEQSDMVMILLNLSVVPDEVIQKLDFHRGW